MAEGCSSSACPLQPGSRKPDLGLFWIVADKNTFPCCLSTETEEICIPPFCILSYWLYQTELMGAGETEIPLCKLPRWHAEISVPHREYLLGRLWEVFLQGSKNSMFTCKYSSFSLSPFTEIK